MPNLIKKIWFLFSFFIIIIQPRVLEAQDLAGADELDALCRFEEEKQILVAFLEQESIVKPEIFWRLSRAVYRLGEAGTNRKESKSKLIDVFKEGIDFAEKALELDAGNANAFYWKAANLGLLTQLKGPIDGLININPLRELVLKTLLYMPEHINSYFFLGQLYAEIPGWPIGYGNIDYAVSLARKGIWLYENKYPTVNPNIKVYTYYVKLGKTLIKRNWNTQTRQKNQDGKKAKIDTSKDNFTKSCFFEGTLSLENISDKEEAREILTKVQTELKNSTDINSLQKVDLNEAEELLKRL